MTEQREVFDRILFVNDGMKVYVRFKGRLLPCEVACAMGHTARVVNGLHGIDTWVDVEELRVKRRGAMKIGLVGCGKSKLPGTHAARDLYTGDLFRKSLAWAERHCDVVYILSAKYGLLTPETMIKSYDLHLTSLSAEERAAWGASVRNGLVRLLTTFTERVEFAVLAGAPYVQAVGLDSLPNVVVREPMVGMQIGERLHWLKEEA